MSEIVYAREATLPVDDYIDVIGHSDLGPARPVGDRERVATMIANSNLVVSARLDGRCVGVARCITDFGWVAYCADLAVHDDFQGRGIGKGLLRTIKELVGDGVGVALFSMPAAVGFYETQATSLGFQRAEDGFFMKRSRGV